MDAERERRSFAARVALLFAALSVIIGTSLPYLPVWLDWAGLGASEIAIITATPLSFASASRRLSPLPPTGPATTASS